MYGFENYIKRSKKMVVLFKSNLPLFTTTRHSEITYMSHPLFGEEIANIGAKGGSSILKTLNGQADRQADGLVLIIIELKQTETIINE